MFSKLALAARARLRAHLQPLRAGSTTPYHARLAIIFHRPRGAELRTDDQMLQLARRVAASADSFITEWERLLRSAAEPPLRDSPPDVTTPSAGGGGAGAARGITRAGKRALAFVKRGNKRKGWNAFNSSSPVPAAEGAATLTALTPQVPMPSPSEMADVDGALKYDLRPKVFAEGCCIGCIVYSDV